MPILLLLLSLCACAPSAPPAAPVTPEALSWAEEAELVSAGLREVVQLVDQGNRAAARVLAERVYTERWEPRLEPAMRRMEATDEVARLEYDFGRLLVELEGSGARNKVEERTRDLDTRVRKVADAAARAFPSPADLAAPPPPEPSAGSKPVVPEVKPKWEEGG